MVETAQRNALRESRLGAPGQPRSGLRNDATPSPSASEGSAALPFPIPLHPAPKAGRSMSHSQGQREGPHQGDHAPALPLGLLAEEVDTESESELGGGLTHTTSHPPIGTLHRTATFPATYDSYYAASNGKDYGEAAGAAQGGQRGDRRFEAAFATLALGEFPHRLQTFPVAFPLQLTTHPPTPAPEASQRRSQWQTHLGWDDVPNVNESRRHSLADIPTRRGSLVGGTEPRNGSAAHFWPDSRIYDWEGASPGYNDQQYADSKFIIPSRPHSSTSSSCRQPFAPSFWLAACPSSSPNNITNSTRTYSSTPTQTSLAPRYHRASLTYLAVSAAARRS